MEKPLEILDLPEDVRRLVGECELTGKRTTFARNGKPIALLVSHDEYLGLKETLAIASDEAMRKAIDVADDQAKRGEMMTAEDLTE